MTLVTSEFYSLKSKSIVVTLILYFAEDTFLLISHFCYLISFEDQNLSVNKYRQSLDQSSTNKMSSKYICGQMGTRRIGLL